MKPTELQIKVMEAALEHAKEVFKSTGRLDVEFFEDEGDAWEFYVNEFYSMESDTAGITFDKDSLNSEKTSIAPNSLSGRCVLVNVWDYGALTNAVLQKTPWKWPYDKFRSTEPNWGGYLSKHDNIYIHFAADHRLYYYGSYTDPIPGKNTDLNEILSIIEKYY